MIRLLLSVSFLILFQASANADQVGTGEGSQTHNAAKATVKDNSGGEYGEAFVEEASLRGNSVSDAMRSAQKGHSWRNTQVILMGMNKIRCRKGGINAKTAAIPALAEEGYCNQKDKAKKIDQYPKGTVWVYTNGRHGNTVVKISEGKFFDNRLMSAPPSAHGTLAAIMVPGCGKRVKRCELMNVAELKKLEKASDESKERRAEEMDSEGNSDHMHEIMNPSKARLEAEESCGYPNAFRAPEEFSNCVEDKLK